MRRITLAMDEYVCALNDSRPVALVPSDVFTTRLLKPQPIMSVLPSLMTSLNKRRVCDLEVRPLGAEKSSRT